MAHVVHRTSLRNVMYTFQSLWCGKVSPPTSIHADIAFKNSESRKFLRLHDITLQLVPPSRYQKKMIEPCHGIIRAIYLRLNYAEPDEDNKLTAM